jgi:hypothetical protein
LQYFIWYTNAGVTNTRVYFPLPFSVVSGLRNLINWLVSSAGNTPNLTVWTSDILDLTNLYLDTTSVSAKVAYASGSYFIV